MTASTFPGDWKKTRIKYASSLKGRLGWQGLTADEYRDEGPYVVSTAHFRDERIAWEKCPHVSWERYRLDANIQLREGDVLLMKDGSVGKLAFVDCLPAAACLNSHLLLLRPRNSAYHTKFLYFYLGSEVFRDYMLASGTGTTFLGVSQEAIGNHVLRLPGLEQQRSVAEFLDRKTAAIDALIAKKERLIELLQEKRQALITQAVTKGLDPSVPMKDSGFAWLGTVPAHWDLRRLKHLSHRISGRLVYQPAQYFTDDGVPFIMGNNVTERGLVLNETKFIPPEINARFAHHALREGDVVMVRVGAPGVTAVVGRDADGLNCGSLMIVRRNPRFNSTWLAAVMNCPLIRVQIDLVQYGAAQEQINISDAVNFWIPTPPLGEQSEIAEFVASATLRLDRTTDRVREQLVRLREYRQALITAAVTGKIDVSKEVA